MIGMDFGTTNSGIAAYDGQTLRVLPLDPHTGRSVMRSVLYLTREGETHVGQRAIDLYNTQNVNRPRRMVRKVIGHVVMEFSDGLRVQTDATVEVDDLEPGRLLRSLKSALATGYTHMTLYGKQYSLEDLIARYLSAARQRASQLLDRPVTAVLLGRPVRFVDAETAADDQRAEDRLRHAAQLAGFEQVQFAFEPIAAARSYTRHIRTPQVILVYDFGGGTLDLTALHVKPNAPAQVLAIGGVGIAGDRFDQRIIENALLPHFGQGVTWGEKKLPLPRDLIERVAAWEGLAELATLETRAFLHQVQRNCSHPARLYALESLIFNFYGFALTEAVEQSKRRLSDAFFDVLRFEGREIDIWQVITRAQFERYTAGEWRKIREAVLDVLARADLQPSQIDAVVQTGGSSHLPASIALLSALFGADKLVVEDRFAGVTAGLGILAWEALQGA